tara:strand:+ start:709 stop:1248 length:540 start_codon:yes stop_codon:yes gene_type:complete
MTDPSGKNGIPPLPPQILAGTAPTPGQIQSMTNPRCHGSCQALSQTLKYAPLTVALLAVPGPEDLAIAGFASSKIGQTSLEMVKPIALKATQPMRDLTGSVIKRLRKAFRNGDDNIPPIELERAPDGTQYIIDGHHRVNAAQRERVGEIPANVTNISEEQAKIRAEEVFKAKCSDAERC